jgi:hypothetical protein
MKGRGGYINIPGCCYLLFGQMHDESMQGSVSQQPGMLFWAFAKRNDMVFLWEIKVFL